MDYAQDEHINVNDTQSEIDEQKVIDILSSLISKNEIKTLLSDDNDKCFFWGLRVSPADSAYRNFLWHLDIATETIESMSVDGFFYDFTEDGNRQIRDMSLEYMTLSKLGGKL